MATLAERLANIQVTIAEIETKGQSVGAGGKSLTRADLRTLYDQESRLESKILQTDGVRRTVAEF